MKIEPIDAEDKYTVFGCNTEGKWTVRGKFASLKDSLELFYELEQCPFTTNITVLLYGMIPVYIKGMKRETLSE